METRSILDPGMQLEAHSSVYFKSLKICIYFLALSFFLACLQLVCVEEEKKEEVAMVSTVWMCRLH